MRRAMTWVYWEPKSRMTICSFMEKRGKLLRGPGSFGERKRDGRSPRKPAVGKTAMRNYLSSFFSFLPLHFSQSLPSLRALTQHLCSHSLPAALARVQHVSCSSPKAGPLHTAREQAMTENNRNGFIASRPGAAKPQPSRCARSGLLLLFFLGIALLADLAFLLGFHA